MLAIAIASAPAPFDTDAARYEAVRTRDRRADGVFYYAVLTTGVYCRPTCAARLARRENVSFHATTASAEGAGYRPCKRCSPRGESPADRTSRLVAEARTRLDEADEAPSLAELAERAGLSPFHFQRTFKAVVGMTPRQYVAARRLDRARTGLAGGHGVTRALHDAGYGSSGRFYERASRALGMAPKDVQRGAEGIAIEVSTHACSLGRVLVGITERGVCSVQLGDDDEGLRAELARRFPRAALVASTPAALAIARRVVAMIDGAGAPAGMPLDLAGTAFQQRVWDALRDVPPGETVTYSEIARRIGAPSATRAVGSACGQNPLAVVVPCHRAVRTDGGLGGYRWGLARKKTLLAREKTR
jgi:AraC family transcriptional regulator of adaptative response/methylated-DNA-[protein]-cysteine methyltransferase